MKIRPMRVDDVDAVVEVERRSFSLPWPREIFLQQIREVVHSHPLVATEDGGGESTLLGYACWWAVVDECHITTFAVAPPHRRRGVGGFLLGEILADAARRGMVRATLEVRMGNAAAISLYEKWGFTAAAMRPRYYPDNREDALIMWKERI